jgi:hypothetical protein
MRDTELLHALLAAETEDAVIKVLEARGLLEEKNRAKRWKYLGNMPNNQSIVLNQQSSAAAALVEKFTNAQDALLLRYCKAASIDPRGEKAPDSMSTAVDKFLGTTAEAFSNPDSDTKARDARRAFAEDNLVLYATGTKARPSLSLYDAGEGQLPENFPTTFCSLIYGDASGSYKGAIPFVQGRFNMGSSGVLPFCSEKHRMQLIVSRVPKDVAGGDDHEWGFTLLCFFPNKQNPSWFYLVGEDGNIMTGGKDALGLLPRANVKSGELTLPRERQVPSGTLVKMFDFKAPLSNICGELFRKIEEFLLRPPLPLRMVECRNEYKANVMRNTVWDRLATWGKDRMEAGFENGASVSVQLETGETIPVEIYVYKAVKKDGELQDDPERLQTGLRAIINGQSHAKRDTQFFKTLAVDKEHIAGSMLVLLDCTKLNQTSRNALFMSNRETFREDPLLADLFKKVQRELKNHEGLIELNNKRYEEKVKDAVNDDEGVKALEELLESVPDLADLFGTMKAGKAGSKLVTDGPGGQKPEPPKPFKGLQYPTYFKRKDGATLVETDIEQGDLGRVSFLTDVRNDYFTRKRVQGQVSFEGDIVPTSHLFNGRYTLTFAPDKKLAVGAKLHCQVTIKDSKGNGPFKLDVHITVTEPVEKEPPKPKKPTPPKAFAAPSRPDIKEVKKGPETQPLTIDKVPNTDRLRLLLNVESVLLTQAKEMRPAEDAVAVEFVFKYGLALTAMGLIDAAKKTPDWEANQAACRERIEQTAIGIARVIVPLCLSLPSKLPKKKSPKLAAVA